MRLALFSRNIFTDMMITVHSVFIFCLIHKLKMKKILLLLSFSVYFFIETNLTCVVEKDDAEILAPYVK